MNKTTGQSRTGIDAIRERRRTRELLAKLRKNPFMDGQWIVAEPRATLRDEFAAKAMAAFIAWDETGGDVLDMEQIAGFAYAQADAMLKARQE